MDEAALNRTTDLIIRSSFDVSNKLGCGFLEKVYENALVHLLRKRGAEVVQQVKLNVWFDGVVVGDYVADLIVSNAVLIEIKAIAGLEDIHTAQCINYLKATKLPLCLLLNFGKPEVQVKRLRV